MFILPDELELLRTMQPLDRDVFYYLAERVDFESGIIGKARRVSYGGMALDLSEPDQARRAKGKLLKLTIKQVENSVSRLVNNGLLQRLSKSKQGSDLVLSRFFWVNALAMANSAQNRDGREMGAELGRLFSVFKFNNKYLQQENESRREAKIVSDGTTSLYNHHHQEIEFEMSLDWQPESKELAMLYHRAGVNPEIINPAWVQNFIGYWWSHPERKFSQRSWTYRFASEMIRFVRNPSLFDSLRGKGSVKTRAVGNEHIPDYKKIPKDDDKLVPWAQQYGFEGPQIGQSYQQFRVSLLRSVEKREAEERRKLS